MLLIYVVGKVLVVIFMRVYTSQGLELFWVHEHSGMFESTSYKTQKVANYSFIYLTWHLRVFLLISMVATIKQNRLRYQVQVTYNKCNAVFL